MFLLHTFRAAALACVAASAVWADNAVVRERPGNADKFRILVDKVMQPEAKWRTEEWMVREAAEAGFNVFSPRAGFDDLDAVRRVTDWCAAYGVFHMPWMRGSLTAPDGAEADGKRLVWADGSEQPLWSPNADAFWEWTTRYVVEYARIGAERPALMGVFLDYENYAKGGHGNLYDLSYDADILGRFAQARGIALPELAPAERKPWLEREGLHDAFETFQIEHWRARCRALREAVDAIDPAFQFCLYPAPGTRFMVEAAYREWATPRAPLILADACTYGRPGRFLPEREALEKNRAKLVERMKIPQEAGIPFRYTGGIDPVVRGADPEFSGKNAVAASDVTNGYWIFYEGPTYTKQDHKDYWHWFTWANRAIAEGRFDAWREARETPERWMLDVFGKEFETSNLVPPAAPAESIAYPPVRLRGGSLLLVSCEQDKPVALTLRDQPVGAYGAPTLWDLRDPDYAQVTSGIIEHDRSGEVAFTPARSGVYCLGLASDGCAYSVLAANAPVGIVAAESARGAGFIGAVSRLYFAVPADAKDAAVVARGQGQETVRVNVYDGEGHACATGQTTPGQKDVEIPLPQAAGAAGTWSLEIARADAGTLEDSTIVLRGVLPILALVPEQAFGQRK